MGGRPGWNSVHKVKPCSDGNQNSWVFFFSPSPSIKLPVLLQEASINSRGIFQMEFSKIIIPPWKRRPRDPPRPESPEPGNVWEPVKISSLSRNPQCSAYGKSAPGTIPDLRSGGKRWIPEPGMEGGKTARKDPHGASAPGISASKDPSFFPELLWSPQRLFRM